MNRTDKIILLKKLQAGKAAISDLAPQSEVQIISWGWVRFYFFTGNGLTDFYIQERMKLLMPGYPVTPVLYPGQTKASVSIRISDFSLSAECHTQLINLSRL